MVQPLKLRNGKAILSHILLLCDYLSMMGLKLNHVSKSGQSYVTKSFDVNLFKREPFVYNKKQLFVLTQKSM